MYFTQDDYRKIEKWLQQRAVKDSQLPQTDSIEGTETIAVVQNGENKVITLNEFIEQLTTLDPFLYASNHIYLPFKNESPECTRLQVPCKKRRKGLWITYKDCDGKVIAEWYNGDNTCDEEWRDSANWISYWTSELIKKVIYEIVSWFKY